ncbi:MAG: hypothetical protein ACU0DI_04145 [Paracoccaceae bacterium]
MDEMTQQNASMADRSAAEARSLTKQSETLVELVRFFKTSDAPELGAESSTGANIQAWDRDANADTASAQIPEPEPRAQPASSGTWGEF